jgi:hypothetical protein
LYDSVDMRPWRWAFYSSVVVIFAGMTGALLQRYRSIPGRLRKMLHVLGTIGQIALPVFVLHQLVLDAKKLLVIAGVPGPVALALPLMAFFGICGWMGVRLYLLYYGTASA